MHLLYRSNNFWKAPWKSSCVSVSRTFLTAFVLSNRDIDIDVHLGQIVCDKDGVVDWCIVLVAMHDLKSAGLFRRNLLLNSLKTST